MIRLPPTTLVLGRSDLKDFDRHQRRRKVLEAQDRKASEAEFVKQELARYAVGAHDGSSFGSRDQMAPGVARASPEDRELHSCVLTIQTVPSHELYRTNTEIKQEESQDSRVVDDFPAIMGLPLAEHGYVSAGVELSPENSTFESRQSSSPSKDDFHYGGFVQSLSQDTTDLFQRSSPFAPDDVSTPQNLLVLESRRLRARNPLPLPRSPLFISQNASSSPERRPTAGLTPRVASRVATHNTPGIIFSQPPRRPPRRSTRNFRHQTNSFSFDSSERSSTAYEQEPISPSSTTEGTLRLSGELSLHENLSRSSFQSSSLASGTRSSSSEKLLPGVSTLPLQHDIDRTVHSGREFIFSSPQLSLPPPFSTSSRSSSRAEFLPSVTGESIPRYPPTSPIRSLSSTPVTNSIERGHQTKSSSSELRHNELVLNPSPVSGISPGSFLQRAARILSAYRSRTPSSLHSPPDHPSASPSPTSLQSRVRQPTRHVNPQTPSRNYLVYNDALSPQTQPQTPADMPEAQHKSRFHPSYTAPVAGPPTMPDSDSISRTGESRTRTRQVSFATPSRRGVGRTNSPVGLSTGGFQGLYGGRENGDEEQNWAEGVRFNNAEVRLWGLGDARSDTGTTRETLEPEE